MKIIDTHAHYDDEQFDTDRDALLKSLPGAGIERVVNMGASFRGAKASLQFAQSYDNVYAGIGIHPDEVGVLERGVEQDLHPDEVYAHLVKMCADPKVVTYGEIGLDYHWDVEPREIQQKHFAAQMRLAIELDLPINVHSREAAQDTFDLIKKEHAGTTGGIIHCYSGSVEMAKEYVKMGYAIGIGGVVTFKNGKTLKKVVEELPLESLVTETDAPYMAPTPYRGKRNSSLYIPLMIAEIARLKGMDEEETARILYENALRVYRWER